MKNLDFNEFTEQAMDALGYIVHDCVCDGESCSTCKFSESCVDEYDYDDWLKELRGFFSKMTDDERATVFNSVQNVMGALAILAFAIANNIELPDIKHAVVNADSETISKCVSDGLDDELNRVWNDITKIVENQEKCDCEHRENQEKCDVDLAENQEKYDTVKEDLRDPKVVEHEHICGELNALYAAKNHDYGDAFGKSFKDWGMTMACIRLSDKLNRLTALSKGEKALVRNESIDDTLMDLANYAIMTLIERENA